MMKRKALWSFILAFLLALPIMGTALAAPPLPSSNWGTAKNADGSNLPDGTAVTAWINGTQYASATTQTYNSDSVYSIEVPGDDPDTPGVEGGVAGDTITFQIDGQDADQTATWASGSSTELNLTVPGDIDDIDAEFTCTPVSGAAPLEVTCTDESTGNITGWSWDLGDGTTSTDQNPAAHTYNANGSYTVSLTVTGPDGSDTETKTDYISVNPPSDDCDVGSGNACVLVLGDVFVDLANIIFPNFVLTGEEGYVSVEDVQGTVRDIDNADTEWTPFLSAINVFSDGNGNTIPVGGADDLIVECLGVDGTGGPANPTCEAINFVRLSSSGEITTILSANPGTGSGNYPFELGFELLIPADTVPGNYATTINIDKIYGSGGP